LSLKQAQQVLSEYFGYDSFLSNQQEVIESVLDGKDSLVLMPTGSGKSICFQIPAIIQSGVGIVVSPLISLMRDQVTDLSEKEIEAAYLNSSITTQEQEQIKKQVQQNEIDILYTSPERLNSNKFYRFLHSLENINLFAVDEAHCVSTWGHDFRPEYTNIKNIVNNFQAPVLALTATADKATRRDIIKQLGLDFTSTKIFTSSFDRPNINLQVLPSEKKLIKIKKYIRTRQEDSGIVYCLSRKSTEKVAKKLRGWGIDAKHYHAGMDSQLRDERQKKFIYDETKVICATIAFGMGIDKPNIRYVIHYNLPKNIESYYQQIGRAGRDGADSDAILFYDRQDLGKLKHFAKQSGQSKIQLAKLNHMTKFAESDVCRRKALLSYFGEVYEGECDNCDVCATSEKSSIKTEEVQKALSALVRVSDPVKPETLVDILLGNRKMKLVSSGYTDIETFGAGEDLNFNEWRSYIDQMINIGLIAYSYQDPDKIEITDYGKKVLAEKKEVRLKAVESTKEYISVEPKLELEQKQDNLFAKLRKLRSKLAQKREVAPYMIYNDSTLEELAETQPLTKNQLKEISGLGTKKIERYGAQIIKTIADYIKKHKQNFEQKKIVLASYQVESNIRKIQQELDLDKQEIYKELTRLYQQGYNLDINNFISKDSLETIEDYISSQGVPDSLSEINELVKQELSEAKINLILTHLEQK